MAPDREYQAAAQRLLKAEDAMRAAENELVKAERSMRDARQGWWGAIVRQSENTPTIKER